MTDMNLKSNFNIGRLNTVVRQYLSLQNVLIATAKSSYLSPPAGTWQGRLLERQGGLGKAEIKLRNVPDMPIDPGIYVKPEPVAGWQAMNLYLYQLYHVIIIFYNQTHQHDLISVFGDAIR